MEAPHLFDIISEMRYGNSVRLVCGAPDTRDPLETKYAYVCHAEMNAIMNKNQSRCAGLILHNTEASSPHTGGGGIMNKLQRAFPSSTRII